MTTDLGRRAAARYRRTTAARRMRRLRVLASPTARAQARRAAMPLRYRWFRLRAIGPVPGPAGSFAIAEPDVSASLPFDLAVVDGGAELTPEIVDALIECERASTPTLLIATAREHLDSELATTCTDLATADHGIHRAAVAKFGTERVHMLPDDPNDARGWLRALTSLR